MYLIRLRNHAICQDGDPQEFLRETLEDALYDAILTVSQGPNRAGLVAEIFPGMICVIPEDTLFAFYSGNGESVRFTCYDEPEIEKRMGVLGHHPRQEAKRLADDYRKPQ